MDEVTYPCLDGIWSLLGKGVCFSMHITQACGDVVQMTQVTFREKIIRTASELDTTFRCCLIGKDIVIRLLYDLEHKTLIRSSYISPMTIPPLIHMIRWHLWSKPYPELVLHTLTKKKNYDNVISTYTGYINYLPFVNTNKNKKKIMFVSGFPTDPKAFRAISDHGIFCLHSRSHKSVLNVLFFFVCVC